MSLQIAINKTDNSRISNIDFDNIVFGKNFSDHMLIANYADGKWENAEIKPYGPLNMMPATSILHYGQSIFEGMKAHKLANGEIAFFRPEKNLDRFNMSARRMSMPEVPASIFMEGLKQLVDIDRAWVPEKEGCSLYIRPFLIATEPYIGVKTSDRYMFLIITCPVGAYYDEPVSVLVTNNYVRAVKGGVGHAKTAGNYARTLFPVEEARKQGYKDILWLDGVYNKYIEEIGTMNIFFVIDDVITTPEIDGTFLEGITRESVLQIANDLGYKTSERKISIDELVVAHEENRLKEMFGTGTAATITHISKFAYNGVDYNLNPDKNIIASRLKKELESIKTNKIEDRYNWLLKI